jgi:hypothetical protein
MRLFGSGKEGWCQVKLLRTKLHLHTAAAAATALERECNNVSHKLQLDQLNKQQSGHLHFFC